MHSCGIKTRQPAQSLPAAGVLLCCDGPAVSAASAALDPAAAPVVALATSPAVALAASPAVALAVSVAVDPAAAAQVLGAAAFESAAAGTCRGAALMLSMRVSTILTAVCKSRQKAPWELL